jgi:AhpD family alkylhydroperoxidase
MVPSNDESTAGGLYKMADETRAKRIRNLIETMRKERGYLPAQWAYLAERDVDFMEAYNRLYNRGLTDGRALPARTRELIAIAILAYRGLNDAVYDHCKRALKLGATEEELLEAIETMIIPGGAPTFATGLQALMRIEDDKKAN